LEVAPHTDPAGAASGRSYRRCSCPTPCRRAAPGRHWGRRQAGAGRDRAIGGPIGPRNSRQGRSGQRQETCTACPLLLPDEPAGFAVAASLACWPGSERLQQAISSKRPESGPSIASSFILTRSFMECPTPGRCLSRASGTPHATLTVLHAAAVNFPRPETSSNDPSRFARANATPRAAQHQSRCKTGCDKMPAGGATAAFRRVFAALLRIPALSRSAQHTGTRRTHACGANWES